MCECIHWAGKFRGLGVVKHHENCPRYDPVGDCLAMLARVVAGMESWAADEDGIHPDCWEVYRDARTAIGRPIIDDGKE